MWYPSTMAAARRRLACGSILLAISLFSCTLAQETIWHPFSATKPRRGGRGASTPVKDDALSMQRGKMLLQIDADSGSDADGSTIDTEMAGEKKDQKILNNQILGTARVLSDSTEPVKPDPNDEKLDGAGGSNYNSTGPTGESGSTPKDPGGTESGKTSADAGSDESQAKDKGNLESDPPAEGANPAEERSEGSSLKKKKKKTGRKKKLSEAAETSRTSVDQGSAVKDEPEDESAKPQTEEEQLANEAARAEEDAQNGDPQTPRQRVAYLQSMKETAADSYAKMKREVKYLQRSVALKQSQNKVADGQAELDEDEISVASRQLRAIKETDEKSTQQYTALKSRTKELAYKALVLTKETGKVADVTASMTVRLQQLSMEEVLANSARGLPDSVAGAIRRSAEALTPFVDTLMVAADTNQRLVDHVGAEIDKYTHMNIRKSPFLSGILFYCVLLVPTLTIVSFVRRLVDSSSQLTVSHFVIFGNVYFFGICLVAIISTMAMKQDPAVVLYRRHEKVFATFNVLLSIYYLWHVCMLGLQALYTRERRNFAQLVATVCVGIHYFMFTWRRVFINTAPRMLVANYLLYSTIFACITMERVRRINMGLFLDQRFRTSTGNKRGFQRYLEIYADLAKDLAASFGGMLGMHTGTSTGRSRWAKDKREDKRLAQRFAHSEDDVDTRDEERGVDKWETLRPQSARYPESTATCQKRRPLPRSTKAQPRKGFISLFFGNPDEGAEKSDSDDDDDTDGDLMRGGASGARWWSAIGRVTGYTRIPGPGRSRPNESTRSRRNNGNSARSTGRSSRRAE